jgi:hypothetical protein
MSEKRRDHRGRILHNGEIQLSDGRYRFKYVDEIGKERCVYSWRLDHNDATPKGMLMYGREAQSKTRIASPATIPKSGERNRKIHSCMLYLISI